MHVLAAHLLNQSGGGPHADAPAVPRIRISFDQIDPPGLPGDLPEVAVSPPRQRLAFVIQELRAHPVGFVLIALVVIAVVPGANFDVLGGPLPSLEISLHVVMCKIDYFGGINEI